MAKKSKVGWLCRNEDGEIIFFPSKKPKLMHFHNSDSRSIYGDYWVWPTRQTTTWSPKKFKSIYGFTPKKKSAEFVEIEF